MPALHSRFYYVYVIEGRNARGRTVYYVGQSALKPRDRLKQHVQGKKYCHDCKKKHYVPHPSRLRYELFSSYNPISSRPEAERIEKWLASNLRRRGYTVIGGH